ncbi:MAG: hypothetical protein ACYDGN_13075 [Acidimicrobiales bacterium]
MSEDQRAEVARLADELFTTRQRMCAADQIGLTRLYNIVDDGGYRELAALHADLDRAVAACYSWPGSVAQDHGELVTRLAHRNAEIAGGDDYVPFSPLTPAAESRCDPSVRKGSGRCPNLGRSGGTAVRSTRRRGREPRGSRPACRPAGVQGGWERGGYDGGVSSVHGTHLRRLPEAPQGSVEADPLGSVARGVAPVSEHDRRIMALRAEIQNARVGEVRVREGWQEAFLDGWEHEGSEPL